MQPTMTHHEINEAVGKSLGAQVVYRDVDARWWWSPPLPPRAVAGAQNWSLLPDFAASQDALDRWVQPEVARRGWRVEVTWRCGRVTCIVRDAAGVAYGNARADTAPLARCLAWLEADKQWEGGNG